MSRSETMLYPPQLKIRASYLRGGTSKGVFFVRDDLPSAAQEPGQARDALLLRILGSPDAYGKQIDGMGGATSSTSKAVILDKSHQAEHDVDYCFAQIALDRAFVDWSGNCGNLSSAVGALAIHRGLVKPERIPEHGVVHVRIWQTNIQKTIIASVPISHGQVQETGGFELDGVSFPAAEIVLDFVNPVDASEPLFPTGKLQEKLRLPTDLVACGSLNATFISAGIPTAFVNASELGYLGTELQSDINTDKTALVRLEHIRAHAAVHMGLIETIEQAKQRQHTPKLLLLSAAQSYTASSGKKIEASDLDLNVRALSMGLLHHAMMGTAAVALGTAAAIPGTLVHQTKHAVSNPSEITDSDTVLSTHTTLGHPSGRLTVGAKVAQVNQQWSVTHVVMSRSARLLMDGWLFVPQEHIRPDTSQASNGVQPRT